MIQGGNNSKYLGNGALGGHSPISSYYTTISNGTGQASNQIKTRDIHITPLDFGYTIRIGCKTIAVEDTEKLIEKLAQYLRSPLESERFWNQDQGKTFMDDKNE